MILAGRHCHPLERSNGCKEEAPIVGLTLLPQQFYASSASESNAEASGQTLEGLGGVQVSTDGIVAASSRRWKFQLSCTRSHQERTEAEILGADMVRRTSVGCHVCSSTYKSNWSVC
jgi:hypothetical protein